MTYRGAPYIKKIANHHDKGTPPSDNSRRNKFQKKSENYQVDQVKLVGKLPNRLSKTSQKITK